MYKYKLFLFSISFITVITSKSFALEFECNFEEVHSNGQVNQGLVLYKKNFLRYEYFDPNLFILLNNQDGLFFYDKKKDIVEPIKREIISIDSFLSLLKNYPNIPDTIINEQFTIQIEKTTNSLFVKRISFDSKKTKFSLYLKNCDMEKKINNLFFKHSPIFKYQ